MALALAEDRRTEGLDQDAGSGAQRIEAAAMISVDHDAEGVLAVYEVLVLAESELAVARGVQVDEDALEAVPVLHCRVAGITGQLVHRVLDVAANAGSVVEAAQEFAVGDLGHVLLLVTAIFRAVRLRELELLLHRTRPLWIN